MKNLSTKKYLNLNWKFFNSFQGKNNYITGKKHEAIICFYNSILVNTEDMKSMKPPHFSGLIIVYGISYSKFEIISKHILVKIITIKDFLASKRYFWDFDSTKVWWTPSFYLRRYLNHRNFSRNYNETKFDH